MTVPISLVASNPPAGQRISWQFARLGGISLLALTLAGCASFTKDGGMSPVGAQVSSALGANAVKIASKADAQAANARVKALLAKPLSADSAVQVALLGNRNLQAEYNTLGISEAAFVEASLPPNPSISLGGTLREGSLEIERRVVGSLLSLLTLPARKAIAEKEFEAARYRAVEATFRQAANARKAYYKAVAARHRVAYLERARASADAAADLTRKLGETGAATKLDQARAGAFNAETSSQLATARLEAGVTREALTRELGLWGADAAYKIPDRLPGLPKKLQTSDQAETEAIRKRVDLIAARLELDALARQLKLDNATRYVSAFQLAGFANFERTKNDHGEVEKDYPKGGVLDLELEIPIFDLGETTRRRNAETYMQAVNRFAAKAVNIRSEARAALLAYRAANDIARQYRGSIIPLRKVISEEAQLQYNGMLIDVFELLTTTREGIETNVAAIEAQRDALLAGVDYQSAIIGGGSGGGDE
ncbi:TolC family protein [Rhizobiales bacterium 3FA27D7]|jgi:outer membrane protein TolC|uniref:TolC family protein n=1 Tax=Mesorhizobium sp. 2RAF21 TaxID=3232995 RepID=UPI0010FA1583